MTNKVGYRDRVLFHVEHGRETFYVNQRQLNLLYATGWTGAPQKPKQSLLKRFLGGNTDGQK